MSELLALTHFSYAQVMRSLNMLVDAHLVARTFADDGTEVYTLNRDAGELGAGTLLRAVLGRKTPVKQSGNCVQLSPEVERQLEEMTREYLSAMDAVNVESFVIHNS